jgi:hypothetical protein
MDVAGGRVGADVDAEGRGNARADSTTLAACGMSDSLFRFRVPSVYWPTSSALRHCQTV